MAWTPTVLKFVDSGGSLRLDLNTQNSTTQTPTGWYLSRGLDLGTRAVERHYLAQPPYDGVILASTYRGPVTMRIPLLMAPQASAAAMKALYDALITELDRNTNILEFKPGGAATSYLIDTYKADVPSLYRGLVVPNPFMLKHTGAPITLEIDREPNMRQAGTQV